MENEYRDTTYPNAPKQERAQTNYFRNRFRELMRDKPDGFTVSSVANLVTSGYVCAVRTYDTLESLISENAQAIAQGLPGFFGYWRNDSKDYFESVRVFPNTPGGKFDALVFGRQTGQRYIYSFTDADCIEVSDAEVSHALQASLRDIPVTLSRTKN
jgi:hypothetical protein